MVGILNITEEGNELANFFKNCQISFNLVYTEDEIIQCKKLIIPSCNSITNLLKKMNKANLYQIIKMLKKDILCLGNSSALLCESCENLTLPSFCIIDNKVNNFIQVNKFFDIEITFNHKIFENISNLNFYFENILDIVSCPNTIATIKELNYSAIIIKNNFYAFSFLPEKSGEQGKQILLNFINIDK